MTTQTRTTVGIVLPIIAACLALWLWLPGWATGTRLLSGASPGQSAAPPTDAPSRIDARVVDACNAFGFALLKELAARDTQGNVVICPPSLYPTMSIAYNGARSTTRDGIGKALKIRGWSLSRVNEFNLALQQSLHAAGGVQITSANSVWLRSGLDCRKRFLEACSSSYQADVWSADFAKPGTVSAINDWAKDKTHGRISRLVDRLDPETAVLLANVVCFDGAWKREFGPPGRLPERPFHLRDGQTVSVPMMGDHPSCPHPFQSGDLFQSVRVDYKNQRYAMHLFLPDERSGPDGVLRGLDPARWRKWIAGYGHKYALSSLPPFSVCSEGSGMLKASLSSMGMRDAFSPRADFRGLCQGGLRIGEVVHSVSIDVDRNGTRARALTAIPILTGPREYPTVCFDRPFLYAVCDGKTGLILFIGVVRNPARHS